MDRLTSFFGKNSKAEPWTTYDPSRLITGWEQDRYVESWALYNGTMFNDVWKNTDVHTDLKVYKGTRLLTKHAGAVGSFYESTVYQGDVSTDGRPLPIGSVEAIPIDPQVAGSRRRQDQLLLAIAQTETAWNWKQFMGQRPLMSSVLGNCLTELVDDPARGFPFPQMIWPGHVKEMELDFVGNVKSYTVEYDSVEKNSLGQWVPFKYKRTMDGDAFRYYKDGIPHDYFGDGTGGVVPNPYDFVPAVWDRHKIGWGNLGEPALGSTRQPLIELNSMLSHAFDFQRKAYLLPAMVSGTVNRTKRRIRIGRDTAPAGEFSEGPDRDDLAALMEEFHILPVMGENPQLLQPKFDLGATTELIDRLRTWMLEENPEASFYSQLRGMREVTAPAAERILGDAIALCKRARAGQDIGTIKLFQMNISMVSMRIRAGDYGSLNDRQKAFLPFKDGAYEAGQLDFGIRDRPVIGQSESERLYVIQLRESLSTTYGMKHAGMEEDEIESIWKDRERSAEMTRSTFAPEGPPEDPSDGPPNVESEGRPGIPAGAPPASGNRG